MTRTAQSNITGILSTEFEILIRNQQPSCVPDYFYLENCETDQSFSHLRTWMKNHLAPHPWPNEKPSNGIVTLLALRSTGS